MKLLIVEDEEDLAMGLKRGLRKNGYDIEWCSEGCEGLELALIEDYECILLDLNLPGIDGLDLLRQLRQKKPQQKVLILSARGRAAGANPQSDRTPLCASGSGCLPWEASD